MALGTNQTNGILDSDKAIPLANADTNFGHKKNAQERVLDQIKNLFFEAKHKTVQDLIEKGSSFSTLIESQGDIGCLRGMGIA